MLYSCLPSRLLMSHSLVGYPLIHYVSMPNPSMSRLESKQILDEGFRQILGCDIRVRVNNEKNEGVKKAPQAHGGGPLWSFRKYDPLVIRFHPLVKYEINVQRWPFRGGLCYLNFRSLPQK